MSRARVPAFTHGGPLSRDCDQAAPDSAPMTTKQAVIHMIPGLPSGDLEQRLLQVHRETEVGHRALAFYLNDMQARGVHQLLGFRSAVHYAVERLDMCRRKAHKLLAVGSALLRLQVIDHAFARGQISWSKAALLCRVATEDTEREWLLKAKDLGCRQLEWLIGSCVPGDRPPGGSGGGLPQVKFHVHAVLGALDHETWEQAKQKLAGERGTTVGDSELMVELARMLLSSREDGSIPGRHPVPDSCFQVVVDAEARSVQTEDGPAPMSDAEVEATVSDAAPGLTKAQRKRILGRDGYRCRCCGSRRNLQVHHLWFVSQGGKTSADNLLTLCSYCHGRVHEGLLRARGKPHGKLEFMDRQGRPLRGQLRRQQVEPDYVLEPLGPVGDHLAQPITPDIADRDYVLQNLDRLRWRGGRMVMA
jgi:hypothetical protein